MTIEEKNNKSSQRSSARLIREEMLTLKIRSYPDNTLPPDEQYYCSSVDLSANGFQITSEIDIPIGAEIEAWVLLMDGNGTFYLRGNVIWKKMKDDEYQLGIALINNQESDYSSWKQMFREL